MPDTPREGSAPGEIPSMLDLVRLSRRTLFPPGGRELYRQIALLTDLRPGEELLVVACGLGKTAEFFVEEFEVQGSGVDDDPELVERAEERVAESGLRNRLQFQQGAMNNLPYRDDIFDVVVAELGLTAHVEPEEAIKEIARVVKPGGRVVLVQLVWKAPVDEERRKLLSWHLGARPLMLVELKRLLREHGITHLHTEAWSDEKTAFRPALKKPFPDFAELFSLPEKLGILSRARRRWGWRGVRAAVQREFEVHRLLTRERILGLDLVKGRMGAAEPSAEHDEKGSSSEEPIGADPSLETERDPSVEDLPLFNPDESS